ncbi:MAG: putative nudix hydrolase [Patescibacteria group bacterium]|jgi:8-oxo-dGTP pyrophosphatase MutT (NUDIX family)|nr:putative nudix hydrolase [Patescibacteria group bacterium]
MIYKTKPQDFNPAMVVAGVICEHNGEILLLRRHSSKPEPNTWCVPAGKVTEGEPVISTAIRELEEEAGIKAMPEDLEHCHTVFVRYRKYDIEYHTYRLTLKERPTIKLNPGEHTKMVWITPEESLLLNLIEDEDTCIRLIYNIEPRPLDIANACMEVVTPVEYSDIAKLPPDECLGYAYSILIENGIENPDEYFRNKFILE